MMEVRRFRRAEIPTLMRFIDEHWQNAHVLSRSRALLDWQHEEPGRDEYAYLGVWDGELLGVLGYIVTGRYDPALRNGADNVIWLALWKLREDIKVAGLGLRLLQTLNAIEPNIAIGVVGINTDHLSMYKALRYQTGELRQFVLFNRDIKPHLAIVPAGTVFPNSRGGRAVLHNRAISDIAPLEGKLSLGSRATQLPRKSVRYFVNRYLRHPFYDYQVDALMLGSTCRGLLASRVVEHDGARTIRIVDWYGDSGALAEAGPTLAQRLHDNQAEYMDFWQFGIDASMLEAAGFSSVDPDGSTVVPTLFEPFVQANRRLLFACQPRDGRPFILVRADGDQDRPSQLSQIR